ncbi:MAG: hypothetical protein ACRC9V_08040, partial [Aeromonas sp.]
MEEEGVEELREGREQGRQEEGIEETHQVEEGSGRVKEEEEGENEDYLLVGSSGEEEGEEEEEEEEEKEEGGMEEIIQPDNLPVEVGQTPQKWGGGKGEELGARETPDRFTLVPRKEPGGKGREAEAGQTKPREVPLGSTNSLRVRMDPRGDKYGNWSLSPLRPFLIIGDSNVERLPGISDKRFQVVAYPGANLSHAAFILKHRTPVSPGVQKAILSFGINSREMTNFQYLKKLLIAILERAPDTFPNARIMIPLINFDQKLPQEDKWVL